METVYSIKPLLAILVSLVAVVLIIISRKRPNLRESWTIIASFAKFGIIASMLPLVLNGFAPEITVLQLSPGIALALKVDSMALIFGLIASGLWILTSFYSIGYMRGAKEHKQTRYYASFAICLSATIGVAFAANLLTLVVFYEILTIATYPLVIHKETEESMAAGRKYLVYLLSGGVFLLLGLALTYVTSGTVDFVAGGIMPVDVSKTTVMMLFALFMLSFGIKSGMMPLHSWLPSAMVAPTPVSALLHAVAVVNAGVFGFSRAIGFIIGPQVMHDAGAAAILGGFAAATILLASFIAIRQDNLKKRLAYSTIGHLSYIILGASMLSSVAYSGALLHMVNHSIMKITLFFCAGAIYVNTHKQSVSELDGIGRKMPWTMAAFALASIGLAGLPPVNGFISKWYLVQGSLDAGQIFFAITFLISGILNAGYFLSIVVRAFFFKPKSELNFGEASPFMVVPLVLTAVFALVLGIFPDIWAHFAELASRVGNSVFMLGGGL